MPFAIDHFCVSYPPTHHSMLKACFIETHPNLSAELDTIHYAIDLCEQTDEYTYLMAV